MSNEIRLGIRIDADGKDAAAEVKSTTGEIDKLGKATRSASSEAERLNQSSQNLAQGFRTATVAGAGLIGLNLGAGLARDIVHAADAMTNLESRLGLVSAGYIQLQTAKQSVIDIAQSTRQAVDATGDLYFKIAKGGEALNLSQQQVISLTGTVSRAVALSGASAESSKASIMQFGQALASGALRGDELNSIMEQTPALAEAIAKGMGKSTGELRAMGEAGQLTVQQIVSALNNQAPQIEAQFNQLTPTVGAAFQQLSNSGLVFVGRLDQATGASHILAGTIKLVADNIDGVAVASVSLLSVSLASLVGRKVEAALAARALAAQESTLAASTTSLNAALGMKTAQVGTATIAMRGASGVIAALGGPIGILISVLSLGATAWAVFGSSAESAAERAAKAGRSIAEEAARTGKAELEIARAKRDQAADQYFGGDMTDRKLRDEYNQLDALVSQLETREKNIAARMNSASFGEKWNDAFLSQVEKKKKSLSELDALYVAETQKFMGNQEKQLQLARQYQEKRAQLETQFDKQGQAATKAQETAYGNLVKQINDRIAVSTLEAQTTEKLTGAQEIAAKVMERIATGELNLSVAEKQTVTALLEKAIATDKSAQASEQARKIDAEWASSNAKLAQSVQQSNTSLEADIVSLKLHNEEIGLSAEQLAALTLRRWDDTIAIAENRLEQTELTDVNVDYVSSLMDQVRLLREKRGLMVDGQIKQAAADQVKTETEARKKGWEETDRLAREIFTGWGTANESMADRIGKALRSALMNAIYEATIRPIAFQIYSAGSSALGMGGGQTGFGQPGSSGYGSALQTGQQAYSAFDTVSQAYTAGSVFGTAGAYASGVSGLSAAGAGSQAALLAAQTGEFGAAGLAATAEAGGGLMAAGSGALSVIATAIPWIAAIYALYTIFSEEGGGPKTGGSFLGQYGAEGMSDSQMARLYTPDQSDESMKTMVTAVESSYRGISKRIGAKYGDMTFGLGYDTDPEGTAPNRVTRFVNGVATTEEFGRDEAALKAGIQSATGEMLKEALLPAFDEISAEMGDRLDKFKGSGEQVAAYATGLVDINDAIENATPTLRTFGETIDWKKLDGAARSGEDVVKTFRRLQGEFTLTNQIATMLGKDSSAAFGVVGLASEGARRALIDAAGGMDALAQKSASYFQLYYSDAERQQATTKLNQIAVADTFSQLNMEIPTTDAGFRALVEGLDLSTSGGRAAYLSLVGVAGAFHDVAQAGWSFIQGARAMVAANDSGTQPAGAADSYMALYSQYKASGASLAQISANTGYTESQITDWVAANHLQAFASGGLASRGWALVGEEGPELVNFSNPGRVYTADQTRAALAANDGWTGYRPMREDNQVIDFGAMVDELRALRKELAAAQYAIAKNTRDTAKHLERWDGDGMPEVRAA